jgi:hypothetical protein
MFMFFDNMLNFIDEKKNRFLFFSPLLFFFFFFFFFSKNITVKSIQIIFLFLFGVQSSFLASIS